MPNDLKLGCSCGSVRWVAHGVSGKVGNRLVCYCDDCQSFAHFLGAADRILDPHGGTEIFQTSPARPEIREGQEHLACMRLTASGLVRWYTACCNAPIGNTLATPQVPFVGLIQGLAAGQSSGQAAGPSWDQALGPIRARVNARFAKGDRTQLEAHDRAPVSFLLRFIRIALMARLRGDHKRSPFFEPKTGRLRVQPRVLSGDELLALEAARDAWG